MADPPPVSDHTGATRDPATKLRPLNFPQEFVIDHLWNLSKREDQIEMNLLHQICPI